MPSYLVFYARDAVDDALAEEIVTRVRSLAGGRVWSCPAPGWFDEPDAEVAAERTCGGYLKVDDLAGDDAAALLGAARSLSAELEVGVAVEFNERPLGTFEPGGVPTPALDALLR